jgi:hypothetical protein
MEFLRFRWVSLQVAALCNQDEMKTVEDVKDRLGKLPQDLHKLYDEIYERIKKTGPVGLSIAQTTLTWLLYAQRQLSADELLAAVSMMVGSTNVTLRTILDLCCNLVALYQISNSFNFVHLSVREYLETREEYKSCAGHDTIAKFCLKHLVDDNGSPNDKLIQYASLYWPQHYQNAGENGRRGEEVVKAAHALLCNENSNEDISIWSSHGNIAINSLPWDSDLHDRSRDASLKPLETICVWGFTDVFEHIRWSEQQHPPAKMVTLGLFLAIKWGNETVACLLLERVTELGSVKLNSHVSFLFAVRRNMKDAVNKMIAQETTLHFGGDARWTLLHLMIIHQYDSGVDCLLENGVECDQKDVDDRTPLHFAAMCGYEYGVQRLLERGAQVDMMDKAGWTPWHWAECLGNGTKSQLSTSNEDTNGNSSKSSFVSRLVSRHCIMKMPWNR